MKVGELNRVDKGDSVNTVDIKAKKRLECD
jgi:hypothetical protein